MHLQLDVITAVKRLRGERSLSNTELAEEIGLSRYALRRLMTAKEPPHVHRDTYEKVTAWLAKAV